jgi:hypothetical protein
MSDDEIVDTSDPEEREAIIASNVDHYWQPRPLSPTSTLSPLSSPRQSPIPSDPEPVPLQESEPEPEPEPAPETETEPELDFDNVHEHDEEHVQRYALRARQLKQINPYAYDKAFYKNQLKSNPEAIITATSSKRRTDGYGRAPSVEGDANLLPPGGEDDEDEEMFGGHDFRPVDLSDSSSSTPSAKSHGVERVPRSLSPSLMTFSPRRRRQYNEHVDSSEDDEDDGDSDEPEEVDYTPTSPRAKVKALRALRRVWPAMMVNDYIKNQGINTSPKRKRPHPPPPHNSDDELRPGETRVRRALYAAKRDIKGDSESSADERSDNTSLFDRTAAPPSSSELTMDHFTTTATSPTAAPVLDHVALRDPEPILIESSEEEDTSTDDGGVDDFVINAWMEDKPVRGRHAHSSDALPRDNLVDYMLTRTRTVGAYPSKAKNKRDAYRRRGPRLHVVTAGAHSGRQTLLPFQHANTTNKDAAGGGGRRRRLRRRSSPTEGTSDVGRAGHDDPDEGPSPKKRKRAPHPHDRVHVFASHGARISTGRRKNAILRVNMRDEGLCRALAPLPARANDHVPKPKVARPLGNSFVGPLDVYMVQPNNEYNPPERAPQHFARHQEVKSDLDISFLPSGITFHGDTYLGKGWLHELVTVVSDGSKIITPPSYSAHGLDLSPDMSVLDFSDAYTSLCDRLLEFACSPAEDHPADSLKQWETVMHVVCQLVSWLPTRADPDECRRLQTDVQNQVLRLIARIEGEGYPEDVVFTIYWFTIELTARLNYSLPGQAELPIDDTDDLVQCLIRTIHRLLGFGLRETVMSIQANRDNLDALSAPQRTAELWISMLHLLGSCKVSTPGADVGDHVHPLWRIVYQTLRTNVTQSGLEVSESTWWTIFGLCALSQFSVFGMVTSTCHIGAAWELVVLALGQIRLVADAEKDQSCSERTLDKRDGYIRIVVSRCFILWDRWHWDLGHASGMFNQVAEIFRSRSFANLRRESSDFPAFMRQSDLEWLSHYKPGDTAFEVFLKLIVQAAGGGEAHGTNDNASAKRGLEPKLKKILSLAIPIGSVPFTKDNPPNVHDLSMLYNRMSAVAIAVYLDSTPANVQFRLTHARQYANFKLADETTRVACIRGAMYFTILMQQRCIPLDAVLTWLAEMTTVLVDEYKQVNCAAGQSVNVAKDRVMFSVQVLLGSIRCIFETRQRDTHSKPEYPDPALLDGRELHSPPFSGKSN